MATSATSIGPNQWHPPAWRACVGLATTFLLLSTVFSTLTALPAGAQPLGCGTYSFGFEGTRLLNDGISNSAGPFAIDLPPGTYTVTLTAHDQHSSQPDVESQPAEQYQVVLDSGYVSPPSNDIPDDADTTTTVFTGQFIGQSNAMSVTHIGVPGINSINPTCVGFTPEPTADDPTPQDDIADDPAESIEVEVEGIVEEPPELVESPPVQDIGDPVEVIRNPPAPAPADTAEVPTVQVAGITLAQDAPVAQVPLLAITGPTTGSLALVGLGMLLLAVGGFLVRQERRLAR